MPEAKISPNLDKIVTLLKNNLGNKTQKKIWHYAHKRSRHAAAA
jgi:hypothetical protein